MKAMIFSAGLGTRFKPWTNEHPKALAVVNGKSLLQRNIEYLQQFGIRDVVVNVHHFADQIISAVHTNHGWGSHVVISDESGEVLETGGGLVKARPLLETAEPFITLNVDILTNLNLHRFIAYHIEHRPLISLSVTNRSSSRCLLFDEANRLCGWRNKTTSEEIISFQAEGLTEKAYSCVAIFEPTVFSLLQEKGKFSLTTTYLSLAANNTILGYDHSGDHLIDVGKPESVAIAESMFH